MAIKINTQEGIYLHDLQAGDYDAALDVLEQRDALGKLEQKDRVRELPGAGFHDSGMWDQDETRDGALHDDQTGERIDNSTETDATAVEKMEHVRVVEDLGQVSVNEVFDATDAWLAKVGVNPSEKDAATAKWLKSQK